MSVLPLGRRCTSPSESLCDLLGDAYDLTRFACIVPDVLREYSSTLDGVVLLYAPLLKNRKLPLSST